MNIADSLALIRSLAIYHADLPKRRRGMALYRQFLSPGDLAFDLGAHVGGRVGWFRGLGARVVAVEPAPAMVAVLKFLYGRNADVRIVPLAIGRETGTARIHLSTGNPMLTTLAGDWVAEAAETDGFRDISWDRTEAVRVTTLDALIAEFGLPRFCKIDVEAAEIDVLSGLNQPIPPYPSSSSTASNTGPTDAWISSTGSPRTNTRFHMPRVSN
jgi:FkbM family methyltransferase